MLSLFLALALTLVVEMPFFLLLRGKDPFRFLLFVLLNVVTNLTMNLLYVFVFSYSVVFLSIAEILVFLLEGFVLFLLTREGWPSFLISFLANVTSLVLGLLLGYLLPFQYQSLAFLVLVLADLVLFLFLFFWLEKRKKK